MSDLTHLWALRNGIPFEMAAQRVSFVMRRVREMPRQFKPFAKRQHSHSSVNDLNRLRNMQTQEQPVNSEPPNLVLASILAPLIGLGVIGFFILLAI